MAINDYADQAEYSISAAVTGAHDFAETIQSAGVYALLAIAAAINRLADAVSEVGTRSLTSPGGGASRPDDPCMLPLDDLVASDGATGDDEAIPESSEAPGT